MSTTVLSMVQPTNRLHLGNYLGALGTWVKLQSEHPGRCFFAIASLHAMTVTPCASELRDARRITAKTILASGIDPEQCTLFDQADLAGLHAELGWVYTCYAHVGELGGMIQFKDKGQERESAGVGLLCYPLLMAADIAMYGVPGGEVLVPVGEDQRQHVEVCRDWTQRINSALGLKLPLARIVLSPTPRVMSLTHPKKKMSKSEPSGCLFLLDAEDEITQKIRRAVTDSGDGGPISRGVDNLLGLLGACGGQAEEASFRRAIELGQPVLYGDLKAAVADHVRSFVRPIRQRFHDLSDEQVERILRLGSERARDLASAQISRVRAGLGLC
jgi:tryptophanyl-tRNA synthetase